MSTPIKKKFISSLVEGSIDAKVNQDILRTHAKESICFSDYGNLSITNVNETIISRAQFTECEISPFRKYELDCETNEPAVFKRKSSQCRFSEKNIDFSTIKNFLIHAFSPSDDGNRPYPSAGGLYPIEPLVFIFKERLENGHDVLSGCYHFRSISKSLQLIKKISLSYFSKNLLHNFIDVKQPPNFAVLYIAHLGKAIFKYRYRGYRHALMEAGSMYQHATAVSQQAGLRTTVWSTFSDREMLHTLNLNYATYLPLTMQLFGYGE